MASALGTQWVVELYGCEPSALERAPFVEQTLLSAAEQAGARVVGHNAYQFAPYGVTAFALLSESHLAVHTWPEHGYVAVDMFFCSDGVDVDAALEAMKQRFQAHRIARRRINRGDGAPEPDPRSDVAEAL